MHACRLVGRGAVQFPLDGKPCLTEYEALGHTRSARHNWVTTVRLRPHTGWTHIHLDTCLLLIASHHAPAYLLSVPS